jgi:N-acetylneuraminic acid mutarotase
VEHIANIFNISIILALTVVYDRCLLFIFSSFRSTHDTVAMDGYLYAIGGYDGTTSLNTVERYNPKTNKWMLIAPMAVRRSAVGATCVEVATPKIGNFSWLKK